MGLMNTDSGVKGFEIADNCVAEIYPLQVLLMTFSGLVNRHQGIVKLSP